MLIYFNLAQDICLMTCKFLCSLLHATWIHDPYGDTDHEKDSNIIVIGGGGRILSSMFL